MDRYIYAALFEPCEEGGFAVTYPDLPGCITEGDTLEEALRMAKESLELHLYGMEDDGDNIPEPTSPDKLRVPSGSFISIIEAWMPPLRDEMDNRAIKKTLTIPKWLNDAAEEKKVNFSQILQNGLKTYLGVNERRN